MPRPRTRSGTALLWWALAPLLLSVLAGAAAAEIPAELVDQPIVEVQIAGEAAAIVPAREVGVPLGAPLNRAVVRAAIARLLATGRFTDVQVDGVAMPGGVKLIVWLTPRIVVQRLDVAGNHVLDEQNVREALGVSTGSEISLEQLDGLSHAVAARYAERGYFQAQIEISLRDTDDPADKVLMVRIEEGAPTRIADIRFQGDQPPDPTAALSAMSSAPGRVLDRKKLAEDVGKAEAFLRARGYLAAELDPPLVTVRGEDALVAIPSQLGSRYTVEVSGFEPFSQSEIADVLGLEHERLTPTVLRHSIVERLTELYAKHGYAGTQVAVSAVRGKKPGTAVLRIAIKSGEQMRVVAVSFTGARHFSRDFLRDQLFSFLSEDLPGSSIEAPVDSDVVDRLLQGKPAGERRSVKEPPLANPELFYYEPAYKKAVEHITELYHADGYLFAQLEAPELQRVGKNRAAVMIAVTEGPRTLLHEVSITGAEAISPRELLTAAGLESNQPFSYVALEEARRRMLDAYRELGYAFAKVEPSVHLSGDKTRAKVELQVVERYPVYIDRVLIQGADRTSVGLIRRTLKLEPGDLFKPSLARESERELGTLGVFTGVSVQLQDPELPERVKSLVVTVSERRSQFLGFSAGLSTGQGIRSGFEYGYRDLFGQAVGLTLRVQFAYQVFFIDPVVAERYAKLDVQDRLERRISLNTTVPRTPGLGRVRTSLDLVHLRDNERDFGLDQNALGLTFSRVLLPHMTATLGGDLENNNVDLFVAEALSDYLKTVTSPRLRRLLRVPQGASTLIGARTSLSYDRRDSPFTPSRGYFITGSAELARTLGGQTSEVTMHPFVSRFLKLSLRTSGYVPIARDVVLAGQIRIGRIFHLSSDSQTYPNRAFFLGGVETVRGYLEDEMIPQDIADQIAKDNKLDPNAIVRSGDVFVLVRTELRFPLYHELHGGVFSDLGNLWAVASNLDPFKLRPTAGFGLRLTTPVGPIALDWGFNLSPRYSLGERANAIHFSIGLF